jgi:tuberous sclerosis 2
MMRCRFFLLIVDHTIPDDLRLRLDLLRTITDNGKDIQNFEVEIVKFMYKWMDQIIIDSSSNHQLIASYLALLVNLIKYNTSSFESHIINGIVQRVCNDICYKFLDNRDTFLQCLFIIETVICYCVFPDVILKPCIIVLCLAVNFEMYVDSSYKIMRNLLGTQFGYSTMLKMCNMLKEGKDALDPYILRGAIFHTNMNLWGGNNTILQNGFKYTLAVLSSYKRVLDCDSVIVTYEVVLSLQTLIAKCGLELSELAWDLILEILDRILENIENEKIATENSDMMVRIHTIFDSLENLHQDYKCNVNADKFFTLIERISSKRSEASLIKLVKHKGRIKFLVF